MILIEATIKYKGYDPNELSKGSHKRVCKTCDNCGRVGYINYQLYKPLCVACIKLGKNNPFYGKKHSNENKVKMSEKHIGKPSHRKGMSLSEKTKQKISNSRQGKYLGENNSNYKPKIKLNCKQCNKEYSVIPANKDTSKFCSRKCYSKWQSINQCGENNHMYGMSGENHPNWKGGLSNQKYCYKFNNKCREQNRNKYNNECFICGKIKSENSNQKLSVHHVDMNKQQGCNSEWKLVPLCKSCHNKSHNDLWQNRLEYLLNDEKESL